MSPVPKQTQPRKRPKPIIGRFSRWVRLYTSARHDPKILRLSDSHFRAWIIILQVAGEHENGILPSIPDLACELRRTVPHTEQIIDELIDWGLIDILERSGDVLVLQPHNWDQRQFRSDSEKSTERVRRHREKKEAGTVQRFSNVSETKNQHFLSDSDSACRGVSLSKRTKLPETLSAPVDDALGAYDPPHDDNPTDDDDEVPL